LKVAGAEELVDDCLWPADAIHVKRILINVEEEDTWAWRLDHKGHFFVNSAYKLHCTLLEKGELALMGRRIVAVISLNGRTYGHALVRQMFSNFCGG
jgi:hypothetical protein